MKSFVCIKIPTFGAIGLGNMLLIWAKGVCFAEINGLDYHCSSFTKIIYIFKSYLTLRIDKRNYNGMLKKRSNFLKLFRFRLAQCISEPKISRAVISNPTLFIFNKVPNHKNYFEGIKDHRELIKIKFFELLSEKTRFEISSHDIPQIAIHVRLGDFKLNNLLTPINYYVDLVKKIRKIHGQNLEVTIFSNGTKEELSDLLVLENVKLAPQKKYDVTDLVLMSKASILICSAHSTFSFWAGFLGDIPMINHFEYLYNDFRDEETNKIWFEGGVDPNSPIEQWPELLIKNIKRIA